MSQAALLTAELDELKHRGLPAALPRPFGPALGRGDLRVRDDDFRVTEATGTAFSGAGEHVYLRIRKSGQNTQWVARQLAAYLGVPGKAVSYAGLKDRHAVTEQWFSVHLAGRPDPDWTGFAPAGVTVLETSRHDRKLRQGQLSLNRFEIIVRNCSVDGLALQPRLELIREHGVPNYFGPQRFGHGGANLDIVRRTGKLAGLARTERGFATSALRSVMFNAYLAERVADGSWMRALPGEAQVSDRARGPAEQDQSVFVPQQLPAAPLWGRGYGGSGDAAREHERAFFARFPAVTAVLERGGARFSRRVLRARVGELEGKLTPAGLQVRFALGSGCYATAVLHALLDATDVALREDKSDA